MRRNHRSTAVMVTAELNQHLNSPISTKAVLCKLEPAGYIMEEPPSGDLCFPLSTLRRRSGVVQINSILNKLSLNLTSVPIILPIIIIYYNF